MAGRCLACPFMREQKKSAEIHGKFAISAGWGHAYTTKPVQLGESEGARNYRLSQEHQDAYETFREDKTCWPAAYGAPKECFGEITPSHTLSRSKAGDLSIADKYPVVPACARHNAGQQDDAEIRDWAENTYFTWGNRQYPFLITDAWLTAEKEREVRL